MKILKAIVLSMTLITSSVFALEGEDIRDWWSASELNDVDNGMSYVLSSNMPTMALTFLCNTDDMYIGLLSENSDFWENNSRYEYNYQIDYDEVKTMAFVGALSDEDSGEAYVYEPSTKLIESLVDGSSIKIEIETPSETKYARFSLRGAGEAMYNSLSICVAAKEAIDNEGFFPTNEGFIK